jgi:DNA-binding NtrC family response regulator
VARILIVEDEAALRDSLERLLRRAGHVVESCADLTCARARLSTPSLDLILTDLRLGDESGLDLVDAAHAQCPAARLVMMTAFGSVELAVEAMRRGADDFVEKPFRAEALLARLERLLEPARLGREVVRLSRENQYLRDELGSAEKEDDAIVGEADATRRLRELVVRVAPTTASVLVRGETGTGKELVARRIHALSDRAQGPFVAVNCSAIAEGLVESELFGHEKGAFTGADRRRLGRFEVADGGTLFLDEIGDLAPNLQVKLLRVLQERTFERVGGSATVETDVRIIGATNRDLEAALRDGRFRSDLYYRLNVVRIDVPPLRDRREDIPGLAALFLQRYGRRADGSLPRLSAAAQAALQASDWPGNVRELENVIHRATILCRDDVIEAEDVMPQAGTASADASGSSATPAADLRAILARVERDLISRALRESGGNLTAAGRALGIERNLLRYKLRKHGLR